MSFSPPANRRLITNGRNPRPTLSPIRRDLSPEIFNNSRRNNGAYNTTNNLRPKRDVNININDGIVEVSKPLLEPDAKNPLPPLAGPEIDDLDIDDAASNIPQPGVDDGFFSVNNRNGGGEDFNPDAENVPEKPPIEPPIIHPDYPPDDTDLGRFPANYPRPYPEFPYAPGYGPSGYIPDYEPTEFGGSESIPDVNFYQQKKTLAQGMMDLALFSANANQLRYVLESYDRHPYFYPSVILISFSLLFQVAVGVGLIWNARYNVKDKKEICIANKINNFTIIGIFLVTVINVFISAFGVANAPSASPTK